MNNWDSVLSTICEIVSSRDVNIQWIIVGSVGSVLQGCEMTPGDIDIYVKKQEDVVQFAELLKPFSLTEKCNPSNEDGWFSSKEEPTYTETFPSGFTWTKGRWRINGFEVEVVNISNSAGISDSMDGEGIWEGGRYIWDLSKNVGFKQYTIPVVPLEIQLESNLRRERMDRVNSIMRALKKEGYDKELLSKALSTSHLDYFMSEIDSIA